jgi:hypothetical protein
MAREEPALAATAAGPITPLPLLARAVREFYWNAALTRNPCAVPQRPYARSRRPRYPARAPNTPGRPAALRQASWRAPDSGPEQEPVSKTALFKVTCKAQAPGTLRLLSAATRAVWREG